MNTKNQNLSKKEPFEEDAKRLGGSITANQRRFMKAAMQRGKELEPAGVMAGAASGSIYQAD
jgi:hypothetical protein